MGDTASPDRLSAVSIRVSSVAGWLKGMHVSTHLKLLPRARSLSVLTVTIPTDLTTVVVCEVQDHRLHLSDVRWVVFDYFVLMFV